MKFIKSSSISILVLIISTTIIFLSWGSQLVLAQVKDINIKSEIKVNNAINVGNLLEGGMTLTVPKSTFDKDVTLTMKTLTTNESKKIQNKVFEFLGQPVSIKVIGKETVRLNQPSIITINIPRDKLTSIKNRDDVYAAYYNGKRWEYFIPNSIDLKTGIVKFNTYHFSSFSIGKLSEKEQIDRFAAQMAVQSWAKNGKEQGFINATQGYFKEAFEKLGIKDSQVQGKLLRSIVKENDFGDLLVSIERNDMTSFKTKLGEITGKTLLDKLQYDSSFMSNTVNITATASKAAGLIAGGDLTGAQKEIASGMMDFFPAGKAIKVAVEVIDTGIKNWTENELEAAYNAYKNGANGEHGYYVTKGNFNELIAQMRGASHKIYSDAINDYCLSNNVNLDKLGESVLKNIRKKTEEKLEKSFKKRSADETAIQKQKAVHIKNVAAFKRLHLLERGSFGFGHGDNIEDRLQRLYIVMENIKSTIGKDIPIDDMCVLIGYWYNDNSKNKSKFYADLIKKGYLKKVGKPITSSKEYAWVLKQVIDYDAKDIQTLANSKNPLIYKYDVNYSRGSVTTTQTYEGQTDTSTKINGVHPTNGAYTTIKATWSSPPQIIKKDSTVTLDLSVSLVGQSHKWPTPNGTVHTQVISIGKDGITAGGELKVFYNKDKQYWFETSTANNYKAFNEKVSAKFGGGSAEGQRIGVRISGGMNGMITRATYIYEWSAV